MILIFNKSKIIYNEYSVIICFYIISINLKYSLNYSIYFTISFTNLNNNSQNLENYKLKIIFKKIFLKTFNLQFYEFIKIINQ